MADTSVAQIPVSASAQVASKKSKSSAAKKPRVKPAHPRTSEMVGNAIKGLKERGGSSLQAIKKYISANYKVDSEKLAPFIKKYLKAGVASGELVQTKGKGASGSFKLASAAKPEKATTASAPARVRGPGSKNKESKGKAAKSPKRTAVKESEKKQPSAPKAKKSLSKTKRASKVPTKKPKAPRPKKVAKPKAPQKPARRRSERLLAECRSWNDITIGPYQGLHLFHN
ncbi:hypothetical protein ANN_03928 [Periplaneta americana]|uniref:H15 domain-containing protein n=1 Tax=Periplaneta americana TaxID=6978 RepID=A0ABQ8T910_PERAM|nr:hypothetical protein ANN_03928 [Periplaneta americana]